MAYSILIVDDSSLTRTAIGRIIDTVDIDIIPLKEVAPAMIKFALLK